MTLGKKDCAVCHSSGWAPGEPRVMEAAGGKRLEFPTVVPCGCRGPRMSTAVTKDMKLDAQQRAAGETE